MTSINFDNVYLLLIAIPLAAVFLVPFCIAVRSDNRNVHNLTSLILHMLLAVIIAFTAAGTKLITTVTETDLYIVADVSHSSHKNLTTIDEYIGELTKSKNLPKKTQVGLVCFGKDYQLLSSLGSQIKSVKEAVVDDSETNIISALEYTGSLFTDNVVKRIMLITDAAQTYSENDAALKHTVDNLRSMNIHVDAIFLDNNISASDLKDVQISEGGFTSTVYIDREETVSLSVQSSYQTFANVTLKKNGEEFSSLKPMLSEGLNNVSFTLDTSEVGTFEYEAEVIADGDENEYNNVYKFIQTVSDELNVLIIGGGAEEIEAVKGHYGENVTIESINTSHTKKVPYTVSALCAYDEIVLTNTDLGALENPSMFVQSLDTAVSEFGKSLITFGDLGFGKPENAGTGIGNLNDVLPIKYGSVGDSRLFTIVIDISYSMTIWSRLIFAKQIAVNLVQGMSSDDYVCIVGFYGDVEIIQHPTRLSNKDDVINKINSIDGKQGTFIGFGLNEALRQIKDLEYAEKQVMLITDGLKFEGNTDSSAANIDPVQVAKDMYANDIKLSVTHVGGGVSSDVLDELQRVNKEGGGIYRDVTNEGLIGSVTFVSETEGGDNSAITKNTWIKVNKPRDNVLKGVDIEKKFICNAALGKSELGAVTVLQLDYEKSNGAVIQVPLYAYKGYGNGRIACYSGNIDSVLKHGEILDEETNSALFDNIFSTNSPSVKTDRPYIAEFTVTGKNATFELTPAEYSATVDVPIKLTSPSGDVIETNLKKSSQKKYYYDFKLPDIGKYTISVSYEFGDETFESEYAVYHLFSPEYNSFMLFEAASLHRAIDGYGKVIEVVRDENGEIKDKDSLFRIENDESETGTYVVELTVPLLITAVVIYVVDIIIRKIKWADIVGLFKRNKR